MLQSNGQRHFPVIPEITFTNMRIFLSCCLAVLLLPGHVRAQGIPNGGFENWTDQGNYSDPDDWLTSNMVSWSVANMLTCEQGSPGVESAHFVKVTDRLLTGGGMQQASITVGNWGGFPAFPFTQRPEALNGFWQYHPANGGHDGLVNAALTRWNTQTGQREYIANAPMHAPSAINQWQAFSSPFLYYSNATPDSAIVSIQATSATAGDGTSIWVDELSFGTAMDVAERPTMHHFQLWPLPATDRLHIQADGPFMELSLNDAFGRTLARRTVQPTENSVDVSGLPAGVYIVGLRFNDGRLATGRFLKQ